MVTGKHLTEFVISGRRYFRQALLAMGLAVSMGFAVPAFGDYSATTNVSAVADDVVFDMTLPSTGSIGFNTNVFEASDPWLSWVGVPNIHNNRAVLTLAVTANTTDGERTATFTGWINGQTVTLTVVQAKAEVVPPTPITPTSDFGPGNASEFYISSSEKAFVAGVYDLHWSDFAIRSDGYYAYTNPNIVDREKGSGGPIAWDHSWCVAYSIINAAIWGGWGYLGGYGYDEDLFGDAMIESGTETNYYASLQFVADVLLPETEPYRFNEVCDSGFAQALQDHFADAEMMLVTQVYFDNYTWYGTTYPMISHGVVCCGYSLDTSKAITDPTCLKGLFIIDSDNDRENSGGRSNAPNTMTYCPVSWDASLDRYNVSNVFGTTGYLSNKDDGETYFFQCRESYNLRKTTESPPEPLTYSDSKSVSADVGSVEFVLSLPDGNSYSWNTAAFKYSAPWLTLAQSPSRNNHTVYLTFNYEANTEAAGREAVFTATIDNTEVTLTVTQEGASSTNATTVTQEEEQQSSTEEQQSYMDAKSVGAQAGSVEFVLSLPDGNSYSWNTAAFKYSAPWLTLAQSPSRNNHTVYLTFNYEANTEAAGREAVFTATIDNTEVTLTVTQEGASSTNATSNSNTASSEARKHDFGTLTEEVTKIESSAIGTFAKARTYDGVVRDQFEKPVGVVVVSVGKAQKSGQCSVKASVVGLDGKKKGSNTVKVAVPQSGAMRVRLLVKDYGALDVKIGADSVAGTLANDYEILPARVGGALGASRSCFRLEDFDWADSTMPLEEYLPYEEEFAINGNRWVFDKAAVIKYKNGEIDEDAYEKGLNGGKTNNSGLKLTYNVRSGTFKGTFTVYSEDGQGKTPKLKKTRATVSGVVVDGYGYGQVTIRNGGTYPVSISP